MSQIEYSWRGSFHDGDLNVLHAEAFEHDVFNDPWNAQVHRHSLGWVTAHDADGLVGFVNVPWDGAMHAWIQDVIVASRRRHERIATRLVSIAVEHSRAAGCEWLHVDFAGELAPLYLNACGFEPTSAGLIRL